MTTTLAVPTPSIAAATIALRLAPAGNAITFLSWDTEGGTQTNLNLLRDGTAVIMTEPVPTGVHWKIAHHEGIMTWTFTRDLLPLPSDHAAGRLAVRLPFNPFMTATTVLATHWRTDGRFELPAIISAPDFGQLRVTANTSQPVTGTLVGSRTEHWVDVTLELPLPTPGKPIQLTFSPVVLPTPPGVDAATWRQVRRGWWNVYQASARWGDPANPFSAPPGILANNVLSDPVSCVLWLKADHALLVPQLADGLNAGDLLAHTLDWWLTNRLLPNGAVVGYWNAPHMLDGSASILIAAWASTEASGKLEFARQHIAQLERVLQHLKNRDVDGDGLIESETSGNAGTLLRAHEADSAWDTINSGYKNAYNNALAYRAFCCMADLEQKLGRPTQAAECRTLAHRLKAAYWKTFYQPTTGRIAWWISADGAVHDYPAPAIQALPITYGLVPHAEAGRLLDNIWCEIERSEFRRFDLGLPVCLSPIRCADYVRMTPGTYGTPAREDGSDTFGQYLNGGCCVADSIHWLNAHNAIGRADRVAPMLRAMVARQAKPVFPNGGSFQNGVVNEDPKGAEFFTWDGQTTGYEGYLVYSWSFLQAVLTRDSAQFRRLYRPMLDLPEP